MSYAQHGQEGLGIDEKANETDVSEEIKKRPKLVVSIRPRKNCHGEVVPMNDPGYQTVSIPLFFLRDFLPTNLMIRVMACVHDGVNATVRYWYDVPIPRALIRVRNELIGFSHWWGGT